MLSRFSGKNIIKSKNIVKSNIIVINWLTREFSIRPVRTDEIHKLVSWMCVSVQKRKRKEYKLKSVRKFRVVCKALPSGSSKQFFFFNWLSL